LQRSDYARKILILDPTLGGLRPTARDPATDVGKVKLPGKEPGIRLRKEFSRGSQSRGS
jgi:hypothetical protein